MTRPQHPISRRRALETPIAPRHEPEVRTAPLRRAAELVIAEHEMARNRHRLLAAIGAILLLAALGAIVDLWVLG